jgi:transposase
VKQVARVFRGSDEGCSGGPSRASHGSGPSEGIAKPSMAFDVAKRKHSVAIAEGGRREEVRFLGEIDNSPAAVERVIKKLVADTTDCMAASKRVRAGMSCVRQIRDLGHDSTVIAPALIPKRAGERVKSNRRDAITLARLHRAGELTSVWVPDAIHEAVRDLVRAREAAADDLRRKRQQLSFLLRSRPDLQRERSLDAGASALACQAGFRVFGLAELPPVAG